MALYVTLKDSSRDLQTNCIINFYFYLYLMLHACAPRFDVTSNLKKFLVFGGLGPKHTHIRGQGNVTFLPPITLPRHSINSSVSQTQRALADAHQAVGIGTPPSIPPDASERPPPPLLSPSSQPGHGAWLLRGEAGGRRHGAARGGEASPSPGPARGRVADAR